MKKHIVCIASFFKGNDFIEECRDADWRVTLVTRKDLLDEPWAWAAVSEVKTVGANAIEEDYIRAVTNIAGSHPIDRIVGVDEFDVLPAAKAREHLQVEGISSSFALRFRDKLQMRRMADAAKLPCPPFTGVFNAPDISRFLEFVPAPWIVKPRTEVNAFGIKKCRTADEVWRILNGFDRRNTWRDHPSQFLIEKFVEGRVFHVDSIVENGKILVAGVSLYGETPLNVSHGGGVFTTSIVPYKSKEKRALERLNKQLLRAFEYKRGVAHAEFLQSADTGEFFLLEVAARVGGAYIADVLEQARGFNLWREWAKIETADENYKYKSPKCRSDYAGIALALSKDENSDTSHYTDAEIVYRVSKPRHVGLIFHSPKHERIQELLEIYTERITNDFLAVAPTKERYDD